jgi:hypothetical protein
MNDRFRTSDADRDRAAASLRDHFAEGRLTPEELDERLTATLNAKTFGDLHRVLADLPEPAPALKQASPLSPQRAPLWRPARRGPRMLPLAALALVAALLIPGTRWLFLAFFQAVLLLWLAACVAGILLAARFHRHIRPDWRSGPGRYRHDWWSGHDHYGRQDWPGGYARHQHGYRRS